MEKFIIGISTIPGVADEIFNRGFIFEVKNDLYLYDTFSDTIEHSLTYEDVKKYSIEITEDEYRRIEDAAYEEGEELALEEAWMEILFEKGV